MRSIIVDSNHMMSIVRAKFRAGIPMKVVAPPKQWEIILKKGILFDFPIKKSRFFFDDNFKITIKMAANRNKAQMQAQIFTLNGKNSFSNDEYGLPGGMAYRSDP